MTPWSAWRSAPVAVFHTDSSTSCTSKKIRSVHSAAATRQAGVIGSSPAAELKARTAQRARAACTATASTCGRCTGSSVGSPGSTRWTAASRVAAAPEGAPVGSASQASAAVAASSAKAASASSASALRSGRGNPDVGMRAVLCRERRRCATEAGVVSPIYTAYVTVRHDELDCFGRIHPAVYLRYLAHAAVEARAAAGFDAEWHAAAGAMWLIRRSTLDVAEPARAAERLAIRTWVEDFRRVRSHRRYAIHGADDRLCLEARTDWVYVDAASGRPRRGSAAV